MSGEQWTVDGFHPLLLALLVIWLIWHAYVAVQDTRALIRHMWLFRQFPVPGRTPDRPAVRHSSRPTARGPAMASDDDVTRITGSHWPPATQGFPNPGNLPGPGNPRRPRWGGLLAALIAMTATLAVVAVVGVGYLTVTKLSASSTFDAHGHMLLRDATDGLAAYSSDGTQCAGTDGYSDIAQGAPVIVKDASGTTVAEGQLQSGVPGAAGCDFQFLVKGIPGGSRFYAFAVSHRGEITFPRAQATLPMLTLGG